MKKETFDAKSFLNVRTLSPLESKEVKGGLAVKQKEKKKDVKADIKIKLAL